MKLDNFTWQFHWGEGQNYQPSMSIESALYVKWWSMKARHISFFLVLIRLNLEYSNCPSSVNCPHKGTLKLCRHSRYCMWTIQDCRWHCHQSRHCRWPYRQQLQHTLVFLSVHCMPFGTTMLTGKYMGVYVNTNVMFIFQKYPYIKMDSRQVYITSKVHTCFGKWNEIPKLILCSFGEFEHFECWIPFKSVIPVN